MDKYMVLGGPVLDRVLGLVRLGRLATMASNITKLEHGRCVSSEREIMAIVRTLEGDLLEAIAPTPDAPLHVLVASQGEAYHTKLVHRSLCSQEVPAGSFMKVAEGVLVPSWPLYFTLRCRGQRLSDSLKLGMELCGSFTHLLPGNESTPIFTRVANTRGPLVSSWNNECVAPAMTKSQLITFLNAARRVKGARLARAAGRLMLDGSASPCETILGLMASLPCRLGGYGFRDVELNPSREVPRRLRHLTHFDTFHPDCYLVDLDTDLEFASAEHHSGRTAMNRDAIRRNDIQAVGTEVKDVTWEVLSHFDSLEILFAQLLKKEAELGVRGCAYHVREVRKHENVERRKRRLAELLPPWPYEP